MDLLALPTVFVCCYRTVTIYIRLLFIIHCSSYQLNLGTAEASTSQKGRNTDWMMLPLWFDRVYAALAAALRTIQFTGFLICALDRIYRPPRSVNRPSSGC